MLVGFNASPSLRFPEFATNELVYVANAERLSFGIYTKPTFGEIAWSELALLFTNFLAPVTELVLIVGIFSIYDQRKPAITLNC